MAIEVTGKQISSDKISLKDLFGEDMWYNIPDYQRPYVWGDDQISNLLDDIAHAAIHTPDSQYFLGSLVLHCQQQDKNGTNFTENIVLDGQQRLTTLYMLHAVIRDLTTKNTRKQSCAKTIFQEGNPDDGIPERLRIEFAIRKEVEGFINEFIKEENGTQKTEELKTLIGKTKNVSVKNMAHAVLFINSYFQNDNNISIDEFFPYLRQYVILIYVASSELEDAFRLFTVLNDRGIKLRNSDILKALNLKEVSSQAKQKEYAIFWEDLEGELAEDFDLFLSYIRTILVKEKARHNLLKEFEDNIYSPKKYNQSTKQYEVIEPLLTKGDSTFELIKKYKEQFDEIFDGNNFNLENTWRFDNLISVLQDTALSDIWIPPLLVYRKVFGEKRIMDFLVNLDNKFSGDWISGETPTTRIEAMNTIIKEIERYKTNNSTDEEAIKELLSSSIFIFDSSSFLSQLEKGKVYGRRYSRYILRKIDFLLDAPLYQEKRNSYNTMSVEHVLPQTPKEDSQWTKDFTIEDKEQWQHRLGNLILLSRRKNASQGRRDFSDKKKKYFTNSIETFPNSLRIMQKNTWKLDDVETNHNELLMLIKVHYKV